jgi:hypothetical protein
MVIGLGWLIISATLFLIAYRNSDIQAGMIVGGIAAFAVAAASAFLKSRLSGAVLIASALALGVAAVFPVMGVGLCPHGCSNIQMEWLIAANVGFFVAPPLCLATLIIGLQDLTRRR